MMKINALRSSCATSIAAAVAMVLAASHGQALASTAGQAAINAKLGQTFIPTVKAGTTVQTAKSADLLTALTLAVVDSGLPPEELAQSALEAINTSATAKARADKDKIAGQVIATVIAAGNLSNDPAAVAAVTNAVFTVNSASANAKTRLTATGQAAALAGGIAAASNPAAGTNLGTAISTSFTGDNVALVTLLSNTSKALGKNTAAAVPTLANFVDSLMDGEVAATSRQTFVVGAAQKVAAANPAAAGAMFGGLILNNPNSNFDEAAEVSGLLTSVVVLDAKLAKAYGEIIANTTGILTGAQKGTLAQTLTTAKKASQGLFVQGLIRAAADASEVATIVDGAFAGALVADSALAKFAGVAATGLNNDAKAAALATKLTGNKTVAIKTGIAVSLIGAAGVNAPTSGQDVAAAVLDSAGGGFADDTARTKFGTDVISKLKTYAAAGYVAAEVVTRNTADSANKPLDAAVFAGQLMAKGTKSASDIANQVSQLAAIVGSDATARAAFAVSLSDQNKGKFTQNVAVGISVGDPANAGLYTVSAITHNPSVDKSSLAKAATIAGAVASAVDEEASADIGQFIADKMSNLGTAIAGKPIKLSLATAVATSLAKAVQNKPGVKLANRMDELGEIAAALTANVLGKSTTDKAEATLLSAIGSAVLKTLSKTARLSTNPNGNAAVTLVAENTTFQADLWEARDIAGSIAQTIFASGLSTTQKNALLGVDNGTTHTPGSLETAFLKVSGKKGSPTYNAVIDAFQLVLDGAGASRFEVGSVSDKETDTKNG